MRTSPSGASQGVTETLFHRCTSHVPLERNQVLVSGVLWGRPPRSGWGNGPPCVKAYLEPLPKGETGYTFTAGIAPSHISSHFGKEMAVWVENSPGVSDVVGQNDTVSIPVEIREDHG